MVDPPAQNIHILFAKTDVIYCTSVHNIDHTNVQCVLMLAFFHSELYTPPGGEWVGIMPYEQHTSC